MNDINSNEIKNNTKNRKIYAQKFTGLKDKIEERRNKVFHLDLQGFSDQEIAKQTGVSLSTIEKDLHYMKYYCVKWYRDLELGDSGIPVLESCTQIDMVLNELWGLYRKEKKSSIKKRILDSIAGNSIKKRKFFSKYLSDPDYLEKQFKKLQKEIEMTLTEDV